MEETEKKWELDFKLMTESSAKAVDQEWRMKHKGELEKERKEYSKS